MVAKKKRKLSPPYPFYGLKHCVKLLEQFYRGAGEVEVNKENALIYMGLNPAKLETNRAMSALIGFGLLDERVVGNRRYESISDLARPILMARGDDNRRRDDALLSAALNYEVIRKLRIRWPIELRDDGSIYDALVLDFKFGSRAAKSFIPALKETYEFAKLGVKAAQESVDAREPNVPKPEDKKHNQLPANADSGYKLDLGANKEVRFSTSGMLTKDEIDFVCDWIKRLDIRKEEDQIIKPAMQEKTPTPSNLIDTVDEND